MKPLCTLLILLLFTSYSGISQTNKITFSGLVINAMTGEIINNAHILNMNSHNGTITNRRGYFELMGTLSDSIRISYISFETKIISVHDFLQQSHKSIVLHKRSEQLDEILLIRGDWRKFKKEFIEAQVSPEQGAVIELAGVRQYKGPLIGFQPNMMTAVTSPISFVHHYFKKKSREKRKTRRYMQIIKKASYTDD
jgi:hypothetical protein